MEDQNQPIASAIFIDLDYLLDDLSKDAGCGLGAKEIVISIEKLHDSLADGKDLNCDKNSPLFGRKRQFDDCRIYTRGTLKGLERKGTFFDYFFVHLQRLAFEVIDCRSIRGSKSHADVRMTMDIVQMLEQREELLEEVILVSSYREFAPLIQYLKSQVEVTLICGSTSESLRPFPDHYIGQREALKYMGWLESKHNVPQEAVNLIRHRLEESDAYIQIPELDKELRNQLRSKLIEDTEWFGYRKLAYLIRNECSEGIRVEGNYVWREGRHKAPSSDVYTEGRGPEEAKQEAVELIKHQLEASDTYIPMAILGIRVCNLSGRDRIEDTAWFGDETLESFIRNECDEDIRVEDNNVWLEDRHKEPIDKAPIEKQEAIDHIKRRLEESDTRLPMGVLVPGMRNLLGRDFIEDTGWFGYKSLKDFIRNECGEDIRIKGEYVGLKGRHKASSSYMDMKGRDSAEAKHMRRFNGEDANQPIDSAIFIDFDNWLPGILKNTSGILGVQEIVANVKRLHDSLVEGKNLNRNENAPLFGRSRRMISCRVYINARGQSYALEKTGTFYDHFFVRLMRLGFEVVDCQKLSLDDKSNADVRMTMDIVQTLERRNDQLDEIILVSDDTDFSPLISFLKKSQVDATLIAWDASETLKRLPDHYIDHTKALGRMGGLEADKHEALSPDMDMKESDFEEARQKTAELIKHQLEESDTCIPIADLGVEIRNQVGSALLENTEWFGCKSPGDFIRKKYGTDIWVVGNYVWLKSKHKAPIGIRDPEEAKQEAVALIKHQLEKSDAPISTAILRSSLRELLGSDFIDDTAWFGYEKVRRFIQEESGEDIWIKGDYIGLEDTHEALADIDTEERDPAEAKQAQEAIEHIRHQLKASDAYIHITTLEEEIRNLLGSEFIEDTEWFGYKDVARFIRGNAYGEDLQVVGKYVWLKDHHEAPRDIEDDKAIEHIRCRLEESDAYISIAALGTEIRELLKSDLIKGDEWFGYKTLGDFMRKRCGQDIWVVGNYVWLKDKHETPIEIGDLDKAKQQAVNHIKARLEVADTYIPVPHLEEEILIRLGRALIDDTEWLGYKYVTRFMRRNMRGEGVQVQHGYVWREEHDAPPSDREMEDRGLVDRDSEEAKQAAVELINNQLEISDTYISMLHLGEEIRILLGRKLIEETKWFGHEELAFLIQQECGEGIRVKDDYVWREDRRTPSSGTDMTASNAEEAKQKVVDYIGWRLEESYTYILMSDLGKEIHNLLGSDAKVRNIDKSLVIEDTEWFGYKQLGSLILNERGEGIRIEGNYIWLEDQHQVPPSAIDMKERDLGKAEARQKAVALVRRRLAAQEPGTYIPVDDLGEMIRDAVGSKAIGKGENKWFRYGRLVDFIQRGCGEGIRVEGRHVRLAGKHKAPR